jgi:tetratricopeptide (TPR) repeat protein/serine/threonine protein kinase
MTEGAIMQQPNGTPAAQSTAEALEEYLAAAEAGTAPPRDEFLARHPELAEDLDACLAALQFIGRAAAGPRSVAAGVAEAQSPEPEQGQLGDFRLIREVGRGGMGVVYEAEQVSLGRRVALKVLPFAATMDPRQLQRFHNEARAAASLDHPHIVKVHAVGCERAVHFYAMQFIEGQTLAAMIADLSEAQGRCRGSRIEHRGSRIEGRGSEAPEGAVTIDGCAPGDATRPEAARSSIRDPRSSTPAYFRRVAELGIQAAEALDHAHALGIVHRDVKPANLLVDGRGNLWVTDFGLAHVQSDARLTMTGDLVGTLRYMSPEQALARRVVVDHRTDVYSLGATLYELLTLEPAFRGNDRQELLRQLAFEEPIPPRRLNRAVPAELQTIVLKAMEKNPADRYATAQELADDLRRFLADEPIRARPPGAVRRLHKWGRRHPAAVLAAAVALLLLGPGVSAAVVWYQADRARQENEAALRRGQAEAGVGHALEQATGLRGELHAILRKPGGVFELLNDPRGWQARVEAARAALARARVLLDGADEGLDPALAATASELGRQLDRDDADRLLAVRLEKVHMDRSAWVKGWFDYAGAAKQYPRVFTEAGVVVLEEEPAAVAARLSASPIKEALVAALDDWALVALRQREEGLVERLLSIARLTAPDPLWGDRLRQISLWRDEPAFTDLVQAAPVAGLSPSLLTLISELFSRDNPITEGWHRQARAQYPADFWLNFRLGAALAETKPVEAAGFYWVALTVRPQSGTAYYNLGCVLHEQKQLAEAIAAYRKAINCDPKLAQAHCNLGNALRDQGQLAEAIAAYRKAIDCDPKLALAHSNLGFLHYKQKQLTQAIAAYHKAINCDPKLAQAHCNLGAALAEQKRLGEAIVAYKKAIDCDPKYAEAHCNLGAALAEQNAVAEAIAAYKKAIDYDPKLAQAHCNLGNAFRDQGQLPEAIAAYQKAIDCDPKNAVAYTSLGNCFRAQKQLPEAIAAYQKAIDCDPKYAKAHYNLGVALLDQKRLPEAIAANQKAIECDRNYAEAHCNLAQALRLQGDFAAALKSLQLGHELGSARPGWPYPSAAWVKECQRLLALDQRLAAVLQGKAAGAAELLALAEFCLVYKKHSGDAVTLYARAFAAQPTLAENLTAQHRYDAACAAALAGTGHDASGAKLTPEAQAQLRQQARTWLQADLDRHARQLKGGKADAVLRVESRFTHWHTDPDLAGVRDAKALAGLPPAEAETWQTLWADVAGLLKEARGRFIESRVEGNLTDKEKGRGHEWKLVAGRTYVFDLESTAFDTFLKLHDPQGKLLAENDDISPGVNLNSRLIFTAPADGAYRLVATSFEQAGVGPYTLRVREFQDAQEREPTPRRPDPSPPETARPHSLPGVGDSFPAVPSCLGTGS